MSTLARVLTHAIMFGATVCPATAQSVAPRQSLTLDGARRVIAAAQAEARKTHATGVVAVVDDGGNLIAVERIDGTFAAGANISIGKARTAVLFKKPTKFFEDVIRNGRTAMVTIEGFTPLQGGIPIVADGQVVGGVGVRGAASAPQDEETGAPSPPRSQRAQCCSTARAIATTWCTPASARRQAWPKCTRSTPTSSTSSTARPRL